MFDIKYHPEAAKPAFHEQLAKFVKKDVDDGPDYPLVVENESGQIYCTIKAYGLRSWGEINDFLYEQGLRDKNQNTGRDGHFVVVK
ncbi:hypothetical protein [Aeromonas media]|uniref:hypothetical protein n=1 Tax=Aeromonas media TaxID=651 RepID=UPI00384E6278